MCVPQCKHNVELYEARDNDTAPQLTTTLTSTLHLKKEIGNARLVSGDAMLWVGNAKLTQKDVDAGEQRAKEYRLEQGKRAFVFTLEATPAAKQFVDDLKAQIEGKVEHDVRSKRRKIRKQLAQTMGFVPVNTLKSPAKPPATPTKQPSSASKTPRLAKPLDISVASVSSPYPTYPSPSPSKSPFRSPFRKKPTVAPRQVNVPLSPSLTDPRITSSPRVREWLSPVSSLKKKSEFPSPDLRRQSFGSTPGSSGSTDGRRSTDPSPRLANKRVRSLQGLLDDVPKDTQPLSTPPKPQLTPPKPGAHLTPAKRSVDDVTPPKQNIVSHYFANKARKSEAASTPGGSKVDVLPRPNAAELPLMHDDSQSEATSRESTQEIEMHEHLAVGLAAPPNRPMRGLLNLGNYCYMNAIVQAVTKLPDFVDGVQSQEWLHTVIRKQLGAEAASANSMTLERMRALVDGWKDNDEDKMLALHSALKDVIQKIVHGEDAPINPEPIKHVMGRKNAIFATYVASLMCLECAALTASPGS